MTQPVKAISITTAVQIDEVVVSNIRDAIRLHVEDRLEAGEEIGQSEAVSLTSLGVAV